jgi:tRNA threonylcarbamoyladenosine biosynthesis protein TsaE
MGPAPWMACSTVTSKSAAETRRWGRRLGKLMTGGEIIGLAGEFGAGKTVFVRGFAQGLGVGRDAWVRSPSFTLINEYLGRLPLYHIDLYRVSTPGELESLNLRDYLYGDGVAIVEWFDRLPAAEVNEYLRIEIAVGEGSIRELTLSARGEPYKNIVDRLSQAGNASKRSRHRRVET